MGHPEPDPDWFQGQETEPALLRLERTKGSRVRSNTYFPPTRGSGSRTGNGSVRVGGGAVTFAPIPALGEAVLDHGLWISQSCGGSPSN